MDTATPLVCWTLIILAAWRADEAAAGASEASCFAPFFAADCSLALLAEGRRWLFSGGGAENVVLLAITIRYRYDNASKQQPIDRQTD